MINSKHNNPPDPISDATAPYEDAIIEAQNWLDGTNVENEGQMLAVDALTKQIKAAIRDVTAGQKSEAAPFHDAHKAALARWKPTLEDLAMISKGLVAAVAPFKAQLAEQKEAEKRAAWEEHNAAQREVERLARLASDSDIEAQRDVQAAQQAAMDAHKAAQVASKDTVKGMRTVKEAEIFDYGDFAMWMLFNEPDTIKEFLQTQANRLARKGDLGISGVTIKKSKKAV